MDQERIQSRQQLAGALTEARESAGLSLRRLATLVDAPLATLGGYFSGQHLPTAAQMPLFRRVLQACGVTEADQLESWLSAVVRVRRSPARRPANQPAPYRGLESFQPDDAEWFFGREALTEVLVRQARNGGIFAIVGASGSGKSSLLRAGLVAALRTPIDGGPSWKCAVLTPAQNPIDELIRALDELDNTPLVNSAANSAAASSVPNSAEGAMAQERFRIHHGKHFKPSPADYAEELAVDIAGPLLIVVDQFEELFAGHCPEFNEPTRFVELLHRIVQERRFRFPTAIAIGLRADFYADASRDALLLPVLQNRQILVGALTSTGLRRAIAEPALRAGLQVEENLIEDLVRELAPRNSTGSVHDEGALPLLSHALRQTWLRASGGRLTLADFRAAGGIAGAVQQTAEQTYEKLDPAAQRLAKRLFLRMVNVGPDAVTRRRVDRDQLLSDDAGRAAVEQQVLDQFVQQRLLTTDDLTVQLSHEALLSAWQRLADWIEQDRVGLQRHRELRQWASAWRDTDCDESALLRGGRLASTLEWARATESVVELDSLETSYLDASVEAAEFNQRMNRRRSRRLRQLVAVTVVFAVLTGAAAIFGMQSRAAALGDRAAANDARDRALSRQLAITSNGLRPTDPALAAQLALLGYQTSPTVEARSALLDSSSVPMPSRLIGPPGSTLAVVDSTSDLMAVSNALDGSITLWSLQDPAKPVAHGVLPDSVPEQQFAGEFSPDGRYFASAGSAGSVVLWDVSNPDQPAMVGRPLQPPDSTAGVRAIAFARNGAELIAEGRGFHVARWDIADPTNPRRLSDLPAPDAVLALAVDKVSGLVAVGGNKAIELWKLNADGSAAQQSTMVPAGARPNTHAMAFSPDGKLLVTGTSDKVLQFWSVADPTTPTDVKVGPGQLGAQINSLTFSTDGLILGAAVSDSTVSLWDASSGRQMAVLPHTGPATSVSFTADQRSVVTASTDGTARIWPLPGPALAGVQGYVLNLAFSKTNDLVIGSRESPGLIRVWNVADRLHARKLVPDIPGEQGPGALNGAATISPNGLLAAGGTDSGAVGVWRVTAGQASYLATLPEMEKQPVSFLSFSPDSRYLIGTGRTNTVELWDLADPARPRHLSSSELVDQGYFAVFSPDASMFAAADVKGHLTLWRLGAGGAAPQKVADLTGVGVVAFTVAFSPDGRYLAAGGIDKTVQIWDIQDPEAPAVTGPAMTGPRSEVYWLSYRPDGRQLAAASTDGKIWIWEVAGTQAAVTAVLSLAAGSAYTATFSADGSTLAAAGTGSTVNLWATDPGAVAAAICANQGQGITQAEWRLYLPDQAYDPPCQ